MKSSCVVCKELRELILPFFYRRVRIFGYHSRDYRLKSSLTKNNKGVQFVRSLRVATLSFHVLGDTELTSLYRLISTIPKNSLEFFRCLASSTVDTVYH